MHLQSTDFELFDVPARFEQDLQALQLRWKALQREAHPDRFSSQGAAAQRIAMQWSVRINEAWQRLRDPLRRAAYLCELQGAPVDAHGNTTMPADFLMQQMQWHEQLDEARTAGDLDALAGELAAEHAARLRQCGQLLDEARDPVAAAAQVRALMFVERLQAGVDDKRDAWSQAEVAASEGQ
jgi:molecular chaperone HscB